MGKYRLSGLPLLLPISILRRYCVNKEVLAQYDAKATATKKATNLQIMIASREFCDAFEKFDKWCRRFFEELQTAMDAHRGFVTLTPDEVAKVMYKIQELLWVVSARPSSPSACSDR